MRLGVGEGGKHAQRSSHSVHGPLSAKYGAIIYL
jgi:hypothetical protein